MPETTTTEAQPPTTKAPPTRQALPPDVEKQIAGVKAELGAAKLGLLARRFETHCRDAQETLEKYGHEILVKELLGHRVTTPIRAAIELTLRVQVGDAPGREYPIFLDPMQPVERLQAAFKQALNEVAIEPAREEA